MTQKARVDSFSYQSFEALGRILACVVFKLFPSSKPFMYEELFMPQNGMVSSGSDSSVNTLHIVRNIALG